MNSAAQSQFRGNVNIKRLAAIIIEIAGKQLSVCHISGPLRVRGRNSDNHLIRERLNRAPSQLREHRLRKTRAWIAAQVQRLGCFREVERALQTARAGRS